MAKYKKNWCADTSFKIIFALRLGNHICLFYLRPSMFIAGKGLKILSGNPARFHQARLKGNDHTTHRHPGE